MATMRFGCSGTGAVGAWMLMVSRSDSAPKEDYHGYTSQKKLLMALRWLIAPPFGAGALGGGLVPPVETQLFGAIPANLWVFDRCFARPYPIAPDATVLPDK